MKAEIYFKKELTNNQLFSIFKKMYEPCCRHYDDTTCFCYRCRVGGQSIVLNFLSDNESEYFEKEEINNTHNRNKKYFHSSSLPKIETLKDISKRIKSGDVIPYSIGYTTCGGNYYEIYNDGIFYEGKRNSFLQGTEYFKVYSDYFCLFNHKPIKIKEIKIETSRPDMPLQIESFQSTQSKNFNTKTLRVKKRTIKKIKHNPRK